VLPPRVRRPAYVREAHGVGVVHVGTGAFHRAHQAVYLDDVLAQDGGDWRILGVSCRSGAIRDRLRPQAYLYTVVEHGASSQQFRIIGSLKDVIVAPENPQAAVTALANPSTHIVSLTITEKGYCLNRRTGGLDLQHPDIAHDLTHRDRPRSAPGLMLEALCRRWRLGVPAPTLLSCDNLPQNGRILQRILLELAQAVAPDAANWIENAVRCPSTVVDRIVPASTTEDIQAAATATGVLDPALVKTEPFTQWVIEDHFAGARPRLELAGVQMVSDVRPFELAKLRLLNGSHSTLAYLGSLAGYSFVHEVTANPHFLALVRHLMQSELAPSLRPASGLDIGRYQTALLARFANPALQHRLSQIAIDGSQKIPQRLLEPLSIRLRQRRTCEALCLAIAGWIRYAMGRDEAGTPYEVDDPLAGTFAAIAAAPGQTPGDLVGRFLKLSEVFGHELPEYPQLRDQLTKTLTLLLNSGASVAVRTIVNQLQP
jgi:fructuronate reductase